MFAVINISVFILDDCLSFKPEVDNVLKKLRLRLKLGFDFRNQSCLSFEARRRLVSAPFLPVLDYEDLLYTGLQQVICPNKHPLI